MATWPGAAGADRDGQHGLCRHGRLLFFRLALCQRRHHRPAALPVSRHRAGTVHPAAGRALYRPASAGTGAGAGRAGHHHRTGTLRPATGTAVGSELGHHLFAVHPGRQPLHQRLRSADLRLCSGVFRRQLLRGVSGQYRFSRPGQPAWLVIGIGHCLSWHGGGTGTVPVRAG